MQELERVKIREIKDNANELRIRLESATKSCIEISGACWEKLGADANLSKNENGNLNSIEVRLGLIKEYASLIGKIINEVCTELGGVDGAAV